VTACSGGSGSKGGSAGAVHLKIWDFSQEQKDFHKRIAAEYHKEFPNVTIEWRETAQADYKNALPLAFQSNQAPDIFYWSDNPPNTMNLLLDQGWLAPLGDNGKVSDEFLSRFPKDLFVDGVNIRDGKTYGFPFSDNVVWGYGYMFLNKKAFTDAGLSADQPPKTWSELQSDCEQIKAKTPKVYCVASPMAGTDSQRLFANLLGTTFTSEAFFDYKTGKFALTDARVEKALKFAQQLNNEKLIAPGSNAKEFSRQQFATGGAAIYLDGAWMPSSFVKDYKMKPDEFAVALRPLPDDGATGAMIRGFDGNKYWISSKTKIQPEAWKFLDWMTKPDGYFAKAYYKDGYGTLAFSDPAKYADNAQVKQMMALSGAATPWKVQVPVPVVKCPDLAKSKAMTNALKVQPNGDTQALVDAFNTNKDISVTGKSLVDKRQAALEDGLKKEAASGLKVSIDCYTFPDFNYLADYTTVPK
jgi:ABC-type glycerol-3-phosphate transport system substrate-binding protein